MVDGPAFHLYTQKTIVLVTVSVCRRLPREKKVKAQSMIGAPLLNVLQIKASSADEATHQANLSLGNAAFYR